MHPHTNYETFVADPNNGFTDQILLTSHQYTSSTNSAESDLVPISESELQIAQSVDQFCVDILRRLERWKGLPFTLKETSGLIFPTHTGKKQLLIPSSIQYRVLRLIHSSKLSGHPGGHGFYQSLHRSFCWPSMFPDCYSVPNNFPSSARNHVLLKKSQKEMKLFPAAAQL